MEAILIWGLFLVLLLGTVGVLLDSKAWSRFTQIPPDAPGPTVAYGLAPLGAITLGAGMWTESPLWTLLPTIVIVQHVALIRACRRHETRRARIVARS